MPSNKLFFLPHTHWDREWYLPFEQFREKLVQLIDLLVEIMRNNPNYNYFLLDGQTIILKDYTEIQGKNPELENLIKAGRIGIGPWYVLPDEFLVSGEALIRNLKYGFETCHQYGVEPVKVGYLPDMFGHISQMPQILRGFGIDTAVVWRGVPKMAKTQFRWQTRDGSSVLALYLPLGYGAIFDLPENAEDFLKKLNLLFPLLKINDPSGGYLIPIGTDHWFPERYLPNLLKRGAELKKDWEIVHARLEEFFSELKSRLSEIPSYSGELRSSEQTQILPSVASSRLYLKELNHRASALLEKYLEPISVLGFLVTGASWYSRLDYLWKLLLENHPHDSICGCSVDSVHQEMENRFKKFFELSEILLNELEAELAFSLSVRPGSGAEEISVWNPNPDCAPAVLSFESELFPEKDLALVDTTGKSYVLERVEQINDRELLYQFEVMGSIAWLAFSWLSPEQIFGLYHNSLLARKEDEKLIVEIGLGKKNLNFPIKQEFARLQEQILREKIKKVEIQLYRLPSWKLIAVIDELKGPGMVGFQMKTPKIKTFSKIKRFRHKIETDLLKLEVADSGEIKILDGESGKEILVEFSDQGDRGDSYNFDPVSNGSEIHQAEKFQIKPGPSGKNFACLELDHSYRIPEELDFSRQNRSEKKVWLNLHTRVYLYAGMRRVDFETHFENTAKDHRLQVNFWYPESLEHIFAESAFELVKRKIEKETAPGAPETEDIFSVLFGKEANYSTSPVQNFAVVSGEKAGMILAGKGLKEIGAQKDEAGNRTKVFFTLCRSIGYLARADLNFRRGLAGPPILVPEAQCLRWFKWNYSLIFFSGPLDPPMTFNQAYHFVFPPLVFPGKCSLQFPFRIKNPKIILSAFYLNKKQQAIVRLFNPANQAEKLEIELSDKVLGTKVLNLEEKEIYRADLKISHNIIETVLKPGEILTLGLELSRKE